MINLRASDQVIVWITHLKFSLLFSFLLQVTKFKKYKSWNPQSPALYSNCFELPSDWQLSYWESQSKGSSKQFLEPDSVDHSIFYLYQFQPRYEKFIATFPSKSK